MAFYKTLSVKKMIGVSSTFSMARLVSTIVLLFPFVATLNPKPAIASGGVNSGQLAITGWSTTIYPLGSGFESTWVGGWIKIKTENTVYCSTDSNNVIYTRTRTPPYTNDVDWAQWRPTLPLNARYHVEVYIPNYSNTAGVTTKARYWVIHMDGSTPKDLNQNDNKCNWNSLGDYRFSSGNGGFVHMGDYTGDNPWRLIAADGARYTLLPPDTPILSNISNLDLDANYTIDWNDSFGISDGYTIQERLLSNSTWYDLASSTNSFLDISNHSSGSWCYRVLAKNLAGSSSWSNEQCVTIQEPTPTPLPTNTPTSTNTPTPLPTDTPTSTSTPTPLPTDTPTLTNTPTPLPTNTPTSTNTPTPLPTNTPTSTNTPTPLPTDTPTSTNTPTPLPTDTPTSTSTPTPLPTDTPTSTSTPTPLPTNTPTSTNTPTPLPTDTPTSTSTPTPLPTDTPTSTPSKTLTATPTSTQMPRRYYVFIPNTQKSVSSGW